MFGHRCLVEFYRPKNNGDCRIIIPDATQSVDTHRYGIVRYLGDGVQRLPSGETKQAASLVQVGDVIMFQINQVMEATQGYALNGKTFMNLLQTELLAVFPNGEINYENMQMLGDYLLLQHFIRQSADSRLLLPPGVNRQSMPECIHFRCVKKGSTVPEEIAVGDELLLNYGRLTPMFMVKAGSSKQEEYCYTHKIWVDGVVEGADAAPA